MDREQEKPDNGAPAAGALADHIVLTSHPSASAQKPPAINWGAVTPAARGPVIGTLTDPRQRNVIGAHGGSYSVYRALAIAAGNLRADHRADLTDTSPVAAIDANARWGDPDAIVALDPYGHIVADAFAERIARGHDIRPTIAVTRARINVPEIADALRAGRLKADGEIVTEAGEVRVVKAAIEPVWHLPGVARRFGVGDAELRRVLFQHTGGMFPELVTRPDLEVFLPPIGGISVYIFGDIARRMTADTEIACRVHDECNGSDVFGSDICTCRPYLMHGVEICVETAQRGGVGFIVYNRKEGRALGEVTKFLVYNARKRQQGGDRAEAYFERTECIAGVQDIRFQELMPDVFHWLGVGRIDRFVSMSNMKFDALARNGIEVVERVSIPEELIPADARVEIDAKTAAGYFSQAAPNGGSPDDES